MISRSVRMTSAISLHHSRGERILISITVTICDFTILSTFLLIIALNIRARFSESTPTKTNRFEAGDISNARVRTNPRRARRLSSLTSRQVCADAGSSSRSAATVGEEQAIVAKQQSEGTRRIAERRVINVCLVRVEGG